ncbi:unnamed protein product [Tuber melanosporum]|uniref:(Perigord truffle) hypothetical protein n=1 Tax=Tuber melanosporum (strain Mel28) TaxID=656061 RepID=D5GN43_TUBMM|nr:uncharacterized protein GSTUM_00011079001 [Tuber melanosporum]CAZ85936.1 unnamed protein product [Tuber melanosporum]
MYRRALASREKTLGPDHPDTLRSVDSLGAALSNQGKHSEAEIAYRYALASREKTFRLDNPNILRSVNGSGAALHN